MTMTLTMTTHTKTTKLTVLMERFLFFGLAALVVATSANEEHTKARHRRLVTAILDFEGIADGQPVGSFYAAQGVEFSPAALTLVDSDAGTGASGNFANEPSPNTIIYFVSGSNVVMNVAEGFTTGFSFFYSSSVVGTVMVYDGPDGTGNVLASVPLTANFNANGCVGDPNGSFCNFDAVGVAFTGTARSVDFGGVANGVGFDDITIGSATAGDLGSSGGANGDPHFVRWGQKHHDSFHGECDLVLVAADNIAVHLRTKIRKNEYSFIETLAIPVGSHKLLVDPKKFFVNGKQLTDETHFPFVVGAFDPSHDNNDAMKNKTGISKTMVTITKTGKKAYTIDWGTGSHVKINAKGIFMNVEVDGNGLDFKESAGLMGKYGTGEMVDRMGHAVDDMNAYGMEWQVKENDPVLFAEPRAPQWPQVCRMPTAATIAAEQRHLRANQGKKSLAETACAGAADFEMCVNDVLLTGEMKLADTYKEGAFNN